MPGGTARTVAGRYRLARPLGRGGMGAVWQAYDELLGRDVAVKEIYFPSGTAEQVDPGHPLIRRALREAQAAARLRHPGIVTVHDVVTEAGRPWIVMELVNGRSLAEAIREHGLLSEPRTARIGLAVLDGLRAAHQEGVLHRDVKPANILLDTDRVVLTDFGIAAIDDATALTATGQMVGSPAYLAPERINGKPATAAADLWALGVTLYTAVTGRSPFQREDTQATIAAILTCRPEVPAHAGRLWPVVKGLLEKDPARRLTAERARPLLERVAQAAEPGPAAAPAQRRGRPRWMPGAGRRSSFPNDEMDPTVVAPPPTLAATTAHRPPASVPSATLTDAEPTRQNAEAETTVAAPTEAVVEAAAATVASEPPAITLPAMSDQARPPLVEAAPYAEFDPLPAVTQPVTVPARPVRKRALWGAALPVLLVLVAVPAVWFAGVRSDDDGSGAGRPGTRSVDAAAPGSAVPAASSAAAANPAVDPCIVGKWRMTSIQVINGIYGDTKALFTGPGGVITRIWPDGRTIDDYSKLAPLSATVAGKKYEETIRGTVTSRTATRSGRMFSSEQSGKNTFVMKRNGKYYFGGDLVGGSHELPYICTETGMTSYGDNTKVSTQSFVRLSHTP